MEAFVVGPDDASAPLGSSQNLPPPPHLSLVARLPLFYLYRSLVARESTRDRMKVNVKIVK